MHVMSLSHKYEALSGALETPQSANIGVCARHCRTLDHFNRYILEVWLTSSILWASLMSQKGPPMPVSGLRHI